MRAQSPFAPVSESQTLKRLSDRHIHNVKKRCRPESRANRLWCDFRNMQSSNESSKRYAALHLRSAAEARGDDAKPELVSARREAPFGRHGADTNDRSADRSRPEAQLKTRASPRART